MTNSRNEGRDRRKIIKLMAPLWETRMDDEREVLTQSISDRELKRRWKEVRKRMEQEKIDFLVMQNDNEWLGGYVKWFTDVPARNAQPHTVIFPVDGDMTTITHGGKPPGDVGPPAWTLRGVKRRLTVPFFRSAAFTNTYDAELAVEVLKAKKKAKIGILGKGTMSAAFYEYLLKNLTGWSVVEAADLVDPIKAVKSDEEIDLIRKTASLQDQAVEYAKKAIRPGRRDFEIIADIIHHVTDLGSEEQLVLGSDQDRPRDVRMVEPRRQLRLAVKVEHHRTGGRQPPAQHLHRRRSPHTQLPRQVDGARVPVPQ
jgi:Xaa-Pro aminopeptidase